MQDMPPYSTVLYDSTHTIVFGKQDMARTESFALFEFDRQIRHALSYSHKILKFTQFTPSSWAGGAGMS